MSDKISSWTSSITDQVTWFTRIGIMLTLLAVGIPVAGALSDSDAGIGIFIVSVSMSLFLWLGLTGTINRLKLLSKGIPAELADTPSAKGFRSQPWLGFAVIITAVIIGVNVGFALILL